MTDWNNKEEVLAVKVGNVLKHASEELRDDKEVVLAAVKQDGNAFEYTSEELKKDKEIFDTAKEALIASGFIEPELTPKEFLADKELVLAMLQDSYVYAEILEYVFAEDSLKSDRDVVMAAVQTHDCALDLVDKKFQSDREVVMAALQSDGTSLQFADEVLRSDREFILEAIEIAVEYPDIDSDVPPFFYYVDEKLKSDREVVLAAVKLGF